MNLPLRLALLFSILLAIVLGVTGLATHAAIAGSERTAMESQLATEASQLIASTDLLLRNDVSYAASPQDTITRLATFEEVCTPRGIRRQLIGAISRGEAFPLSDAGFAAVLEGKSWSEVVPLDPSIDGEGDLAQHLIFNQPVLQNDHVIAVAQIARPMETQEARLLTLRNWLVLGSGMATAVVFGLTWAVAAHGLHPLRRIVRALRAPANNHNYHEFNNQIEPSQFDGELNQLATSLNLMLQDLQHTHHLAEAQQAFVADVSHELRAPLTTVRGNLGLLQRNLSEDDRRAVLRDAVDEVERMSRLVNQLMLVARASAQPGAQPGALSESNFCCESIGLKPLVEEMTRKAAALAQDRRLFLAITDEVSATGNADALRQVLLILLDNAAKFTPAGGNIVVSLEAEGQHAHISVRDTGVGIAPQDLPHVFDRGYRGGSTSEGQMQAASGNGLGLSIAKQLIQAMGGTLQVTSQMGEGSVFVIGLPLVQDCAEQTG